MKSDQFSIYRMENNSFLGDCLCIVYHASQSEVKRDGLTGSDIAIYIKTSKNISTINSIKDFGKGTLFEKSKSVILRIASECQFGVFGDSHCDCESQRVACLDAIKVHGQGVYIQLPQEGQGRGLHYKARELQLQIHGTAPDGKFVGKKDIYDASEMLTGSSEVDIRKFTILNKVFKELHLSSYTYTLISSNPQKAFSLANEVGINILGAHDVTRELNLDNVGEYLAKIYKKRFALSDEDMRNIFEVLFNAKKIPDRVLALLGYLRDDLKLGRKFTVNEALLQKIANLADEKHTAQTPVSMFDTSSDNKYREYQVELAVSEDDIDRLAKAGILEGISDFAYEQNYFYDLVYFKDTVARDLKIRRKSNVDGKKELLESRLVYKSPVGDNEYEIKSIQINDREVADLLSNSLEGYEVYYVPVFTHECLHESRYPELLILIKCYSSNFRTISIMGVRLEAESMMKEMSKFINIEITPDPTNIRTINKDLSLEFDYNKLSAQELAFFNKYRVEV